MSARFFRNAPSDFDAELLRPRGALFVAARNQDKALAAMAAGDPALVFANSERVSTCW